MYVNTPKSSRISAEFNMIYEESSTTPIAAQARASFLASSVTRNGTIPFTVTERANIDRADAVSIAQDAVRTGFTGWNLLLHKRLGLRLSIWASLHGSKVFHRIFKFSPQSRTQGDDRIRIKKSKQKLFHIDSLFIFRAEGSSRPSALLFLQAG